MQKIYEVILELKVPSVVGGRQDFRLLARDIIYAVNEFNKKFKNFKELKLIFIKAQKIKFLFSIEVVDNTVPVSARDLRVFSRRLYHNRGWSIYSRETSKLFTATTFEDITPIYKNKYKAIRTFPEDLLNTVSSDLSQDINSQLEDQQAVEAFQSLIGIQNLGDEEIRLNRKKSIIEIKRILLSTLSK